MRCAFWAWAETELGNFLVATTERGVCFLALNDAGAVQALKDFVRGVDPAASVRRDDDRLEQAVRELAEYAAGDRRAFDLALDLHGTPFQVAVWNELARIPFGETRTYGQIARAVGRPRGAQAVGAANGRNPVPIIVPCHRVLASDGIGGFSGGLERKHQLLAHEGVLLGF